MIKLKRGNKPTFWTQANVQKWTQRWIAKDHLAKRWQWPIHQGTPINQSLKPNMRGWHYSKCAFCESPLSGETIEHFRSKTRYPKSAFRWFNLFLSCSGCNTLHAATYDYRHCLKPDRDDPSQFLIISRKTHRVMVRDDLTAAQKQIAQLTIDRYRLNRVELVELRKTYVTNQGQLLGEPIPVEKLRVMSQPDQPFSLLGRYLLEASGSSQV